VTTLLFRPIFTSFMEGEDGLAVRFLVSSKHLSHIRSKSDPSASGGSRCDDFGQHFAQNICPHTRQLLLLFVVSLCNEKIFLRRVLCYVLVPSPEQIEGFSTFKTLTMIFISTPSLFLEIVSRNLYCHSFIVFTTKHLRILPREQRNAVIISIYVNSVHTCVCNYNVSVCLIYVCM